MATSLAGCGWESLPERQKLSRLPLAPDGAPNVLLIVLDTVRAQNMSLYGYHRPTTPYLEYMAKRGVLFERAISTAPWTLPSHAAMFTGRFRHELSLGWAAPLGSKYPTLADVLRGYGYETAGFVANMDYCCSQFGLSRGFIHYEDYLVSPGQVLMSSSLGRSLAQNFELRRAIGNYEIPGRKNAERVNHDFLSWLSRHGQRPFFAFLNYYDAHDPYLPPAPYDVMYGPKAPRENPWQLPKRKLSQQQIQVEMDAYDGAITYLDHQLNRLFSELEKRAVLDNTLVIITSDHGEQFGEHNLIGHANSLYLQTLHVPLLLLFPNRIPASTRISEAVTLQNLSATALDLLGLDGEVSLPGKSLRQSWTVQPEQKPRMDASLLSEVNFSPGLPKWYPVSKGNMKSIVMGSYHYIKNGDGTEELYDFEKDPLDQTNIVNSSQGFEMLSQLRASLHSLLSSRNALGGFESS